MNISTTCIKDKKSQNGHNSSSFIHQGWLRYRRQKAFRASFRRRRISQKLSPTRNCGLSLLLRRQRSHISRVLYPHSALAVPTSESPMDSERATRFAICAWYNLPTRSSSFRHGLGTSICQSAGLQRLRRYPHDRN